MKIKTLVVDDTAIFRRIIADVVKAIPNAELVDAARDGPTALALVAESEPDLVLLDVAMPGMDGIEVLQRLREKHPAVDVVMVSGPGICSSDYGLFPWRNLRRPIFPLDPDIAADLPPAS